MLHKIRTFLFICLTLLFMMPFGTALADNTIIKGIKEISSNAWNNAWNADNTIIKGTKEILFMMPFGTALAEEKASAPNIGGLELMQAAKEAGVSYEGCSFTDNFASDTALGSGNSQILKTTICWLQDVSASLGVGMALGSTMIKMGCDDWWDRIVTIVIGALIFLVFFLIYVMFPLKLLDAFIRLGFIFALMPLWIVLWVFPVTAGYTKKAWDMFVSTLFFFLSLSIIVALILLLMNEAIQPDNIRKDIFQAMLNGQTQQAANMMSFSRTFFITLAFGLLSFKLLGTAEALANAFIGAPSHGLDKQMTQNVSQTINLTRNATKATAGLIGAGAGAIRNRSKGSGQGGNGGGGSDNNTGGGQGGNGGGGSDNNTGGGSGGGGPGPAPRGTFGGGSNENNNNNGPKPEPTPPPPSNNETQGGKNPPISNDQHTDNKGGGGSGGGGPGPAPRGTFGGGSNENNNNNGPKPEPTPPPPSNNETQGGKNPPISNDQHTDSKGGGEQPVQTGGNTNSSGSSDTDSSSQSSSGGSDGGAKG